MTRTVSTAILGGMFGLSVVGLLLSSLVFRPPSKDLVFSCKFPKREIEFPHPQKDLYSLPERDPFFYPSVRVEVDLTVEQKGTTQETSVTSPFVYKGMVKWGEELVAILYVKKDKKTKFVKLGEFVDGYKVLDITEDTVVLSKKGGLSLITLNLGGLRER